MVTNKNNLEKAYQEFTTEIKPKVEEFNDRKGSFNLKDLKMRVVKIGDPRYLPSDRTALFLGVSDLVEQVQKSKLYTLLVDYVKENGHHIITKPLSFKDDFSKLVIIEHYALRYGEDHFSTVFSFYTYKEVAPNNFTGSCITLLEIEKNIKIRIPSLSEIMSDIILIED